MKFCLVPYEHREPTADHPGGQCVPGDPFGFIGLGGYAFAAYPSGDVPDGALEVARSTPGNGIDAEFRSIGADRWQRVTGYTPKASTVRGAIFEHLTNSPQTLEPTAANRSEVWLGNQLVVDQPFNIAQPSAHRNRLLNRYRRRFRDMVATGAPRWLIRQHLDDLLAKRTGVQEFARRKTDGEMWRAILPPEWETEQSDIWRDGPSERDTAHADDFNRPTIGTNWDSWNRNSPYANNKIITIVSNTTFSKPNTGDVIPVYQSAVSSADHECYGYVVSVVNNFGPAIRYQEADWSTTRGGYYCFGYSTSIYLRIPGPDADVTSAAAKGHTGGDGWYKVSGSGSTIKSYFGGTGGTPSWSELQSATNATYSGLYGGWGNWGSGTHNGDDWGIDDGLSGGSIVPLLDGGMMRGGLQELSGGL